MSKWSPAYFENDVEVRATKTLSSGHYALSTLELKHKCFNGDWTNWLIREQIKRDDAVCAILWDPRKDKVVMVEQFRVGVLSRQDSPSPWLVEIVAGLIDPGETPEQAIRREAEEEAGCRIKELIPIAEFYNTPGGFSEKSTVFCGIIDLPDSLVNNPDDDEDLKIHVFEWPQIQNLLSNTTTSASSLVALQWLTFHHDSLKTKYA